MSEFDNPEIYRSVLESLQTGVYFVDADQKILFWNHGAEKITGYYGQEVVGSFCRDNLLGKGQGDRNVLSDAADALASVLRDGKPTIADVSLRHKLGHRIYVRMRAVPIRNDHGTIIGAAESFDESLSASEWDRRQSKLAGYGCIDEVTGVLNRPFIESQLREKLALFAQHPMPFGILCVEVDNIDRLRANFGQAIVMPVLRIVGQTVENSLRPTDFLGRAGDHRFLAILLECDDFALTKLTERIIKMVRSSEVEWWGDNRTVTASFGGTCVRYGDTVDSILKRAETALEASAVAGGDRFTLSPK